MPGFQFSGILIWTVCFSSIRTSKLPEPVLRRFAPGKRIHEPFARWWEHTLGQRRAQELTHPAPSLHQCLLKSHQLSAWLGSSELPIPQAPSRQFQVAPVCCQGSLPMSWCWPELIHHISLHEAYGQPTSCMVIAMTMPLQQASAGLVKVQLCFPASVDTSPRHSSDNRHA